MCRRQELSAAAQTSAPVSSMWRTLSARMAADVSAFLTANVPPKPQHSRRLGQLGELEPANRSQEPVRRVADVEHAQRVAGRVVGDAVREGGADVLDAEPADEELAQLEDARDERRDLALEGRIPLGQARVEVTHRADA